MAPLSSLYLFPIEPWKQFEVAPDTELGTGYEKNISYYVDVIRGFIWLESDL